jgi:hypothetical protein
VSVVCFAPVARNRGHKNSAWYSAAPLGQRRTASRDRHRRTGFLLSAMSSSPFGATGWFSSPSAWPQSWRNPWSGGPRSEGLLTVSSGASSFSLCCGKCLCQVAASDLTSPCAHRAAADSPARRKMLYDCLRSTIPSIAFHRPADLRHVAPPDRRRELRIEPLCAVGALVVWIVRQSCSPFALYTLPHADPAQWAHPSAAALVIQSVPSCTRTSRCGRLRGRGRSVKTCRDFRRRRELGLRRDGQHDPGAPVVCKAGCFIRARR